MVHARIVFHAASLAVALLLFLAPNARAVTKVLQENDLVLCTDVGRATFGALKILQIDPDKHSLRYRWYILPKDQFNLNFPGVSSGTGEVHQVRGRAVISFGPFVLEWHGSGQEKGIVSAHGTLGVVPLLIASSAIPEATRIADVRSGFAYEVASVRETPDPLGLQQSFAELPKARIGIGVAQTFADIGMGAEEPVVEISRIDTDSNAFKAGLRKGQYLLFFNGIEVLNADDFQKALQGVQPGAPVKVSVLKDGTVEDISFEAENRLALPATSPSKPLDPSLSPEQRARAESSEEVRNLMNQTLEAVRALSFD